MGKSLGGNFAAEGRITGRDTEVSISLVFSDIMQSANELDFLGFNLEQELVALNTNKENTRHLFEDINSVSC